MPSSQPQSCRGRSAPRPSPPGLHMPRAGGAHLGRQRLLEEAQAWRCTGGGVDVRIQDAARDHCALPASVRAVLAAAARARARCAVLTATRAGFQDRNRAERRRRLICAHRWLGCSSPAQRSSTPPKGAAWRCCSSAQKPSAAATAALPQQQQRARASVDAQRRLCAASARAAARHNGCWSAGRCDQPDLQKVTAEKLQAGMGCQVAQKSACQTAGGSERCPGAGTRRPSARPAPGGCCCRPGRLRCVRRLWRSLQPQAAARRRAMSRRAAASRSALAAPAPARAARALAVLLLCAHGSHAALSVDGSLAAGAWNYAPTYPSVRASGITSVPFAYTPGVVNASKYNASAVASTTGLVRARAAACRGSGCELQARRRCCLRCGLTRLLPCFRATATCR